MSKHNHSQGTDYSKKRRRHSHSHAHPAVDAAMLTSARGIWALKWSFAGLLITAVFQLIIVKLSGSVALLADTIHNLGDATTAIPLWIAFRLERLKPTKRFTYGYGRVEDLAGVMIVLTILTSAIVAGYVSIDRFFHPQQVKHLGAVIAAALIGFLGNEAVAVFRIKIGKEIESAALIADGYHARVDGFTSLAVLFGAVGVWLGFPLADPIVGLLITAAILKIVWDSVKTVFTRLLDGVEPEIIDEIRHAAGHVPQVREITEIRARWIGHFVHVEINVAVSPRLSVEEGHNIAKEVEHELIDHLPYLSNAIIHIDPLNASGEAHHPVAGQVHNH